MSQEEFTQLMQSVADGWNEGSPAKSINCFTDDAVYIEPPDKQFFKGNKELFDYFGGESAREGIMNLKWHHLFLNEENHTGAGEYTFEMNSIIHHGMVLVELKNGKIALWREYDIPGKISYQDFIDTKNKVFKCTIKDLKNH